METDETGETTFFVLCFEDVAVPKKRPSTFIGAKVWHFATLAPGLEPTVRRTLTVATRLTRAAGKREV